MNLCYHQTMIKNRFVLIDAFALIFRAYYGMPQMTSPDGKNVGAVYGFTSALLSAIRTLMPQYLAVGIDMGKPTLRHKEFKEYKIHRPEAPDELKEQIPMVFNILKTMDVPTFGVEGFEGEDVIASIIANLKFKIKNLKLDFIIVTGDMDLLQLVDESVKVYSMARGVNSATMYDIAKVKERYGLNPSQFVDFKALKGDASDNIPGVKGIGEKGAIKLIQEFGSIENLYKNKNNSKISQKLQSILSEKEEIAKLSYKLSKIQSDAPLDFKLSSAKVDHYNKEKTIELFQELGFKSLISRLPNQKTTSDVVLKVQKPESQQKLF